MVVDLYFEPIFWLLRGKRKNLPRKIAFLPRKIVGLTDKVLADYWSADNRHLTVGRLSANTD